MNMLIRHPKPVSALSVIRIHILDSNYLGWQPAASSPLCLLLSTKSLVVTTFNHINTHEFRECNVSDCHFGRGNLWSYFVRRLSVNYVPQRCHLWSTFLMEVSCIDLQRQIITISAPKPSIKEDLHCKIEGSWQLTPVLPKNKRLNLFKLR
jgi:hypothetical protein